MTGKFGLLSFAGAKYLGRCAGIALTAAALIGTARAQTPGAVPTSSPTLASVSEDTHYRIGAGDVLSIFVRKAPELSMEAVRVDQRGMIRIPMIEEGVPAACKTESELSDDIKGLYLEYKNNPSVQVFVKEFHSQPVAVIGAVDKPGQWQLRRQVRLLEIISLSGGPTEKAGRVVNVIHSATPNLCGKSTPGNGANAEQSLSVFKLTDTLKGVEGSNPFIQPGDVISLPEADQVFVVGYVFSPRSIPLKDKPITVSRAIAMAGGPQREASTSKVRIIRQTPDGESKQEIAVDLKAILKLKAEDITLRPNDIVEVGASTTKQIINMLTGTLPSALSQGVVRAIP